MKKQNKPRELKKPCPFCGRGATLLSSDKRSWVHCGYCGATGPQSSKFGDDDAISAWNNRYEEVTLCHCTDSK
jgi:Lar family restriction alleviation protein